MAARLTLQGRRVVLAEVPEFAALFLLCRRSYRVVAFLVRGKLCACRVATLEELSVGLDTEAPLEIGDAIKLSLDSFNAAWICLERSEERVKVGRNLA